MNAKERLEAAITKLESLRGRQVDWDDRSYTRSVILALNENAHVVDQIGDDGPTIYSVDSFVTLHRTIDAQLAILRSARADADYGREPALGALALADAILGGD